MVLNIKVSLYTQDNKSVTIGEVKLNYTEIMEVNL